MPITRQTKFTQADAKNFMCDVIFDKPFSVRANESIDIGVKFTMGSEEQFFCQTQFGYGGDQIRHNEHCNRNNEHGVIRVEDSDWSTKGETNVEYG